MTHRLGIVNLFQSQSETDRRRHLKRLDNQQFAYSIHFIYPFCRLMTWTDPTPPNLAMFNKYSQIQNYHFILIDNDKTARLTKLYLRLN